MSRRTLVPIMLAGVLTACQQAVPAGLSDADKVAIKAVTDSAVALAETRDFAAYTALYNATDAVLLPSNGAPVTGRDAITALLQTFPPMPPTSGSSNWRSTAAVISHTSTEPTPWISRCPARLHRFATKASTSRSGAARPMAHGR